MIHHAASHALVSVIGVVVGPVLSLWIQDWLPLTAFLLVDIAAGIQNLFEVRIKPELLGHCLVVLFLAFVWGASFYLLIADRKP